MCAETEKKCSKIVWDGIKGNRRCWKTEDGREWYEGGTFLQGFRVQGQIRDGQMCEIGHLGGLWLFG